MTISLQGLTVRLEGHKVTVARILIDSIIDRQGLLKTGDVILQANGKNIKDPEQLQTAIEESGAFVVFKILPSNIDQQEEENSKPKAGKAAKVLKFIYSEKATKFCEVSTLLLSYAVPVKSKVDISQYCGLLRIHELYILVIIWHISQITKNLLLNLIQIFIETFFLFKERWTLFSWILIDTRLICTLRNDLKGTL